MAYNIWIWVWIALAVILAIAEFFTGGYYLLPFAVGAATAAALEFAVPGSVTMQWIGFVGVSSALFIVIQRVRLARRHGGP